MTSVVPRFSVFSLVTGLLMVMLACQAWASDGIRTERVRFAKGANGATVEGEITGYQTVDYVVRASQGQSMNVSLATKNTATYFNILAPGENEVAFFNGSTSENQYEGTLPATGDYKIRVYMMRSAARRNEVAQYRLEIIISGAVAHGSASHDAKVAGTDYHATAQIRCVAEPGKPMVQCNAGVKRVAGGGTVHVTTPDGGSRVIMFSNGKVSGTDASAPFRTERRDDWTIVRIGSAEVYEIPDAFIFGG